MTKHTWSVIGLAVAIGLTFHVCAHAQTFYVGPSAYYLVSTNAPGSTDNQSSPVRYMVGGTANWLLGKKAEVRATLGYRSESGSFSTPASDLPSTTSVLQPHSVQVVDNPSSEPQLQSSLAASSIELSASLCFPLMPLDTTGSVIGLAIGALTDVVLHASQTDDYSGIPNHIGDKTVTATYQQQVGLGALIGAYLVVPMGSTTRLSFDLQYVFRQPTTLTTNTTPPVEQNIGWLIGKGLRLGGTVYFAM